MTYLAGLVLGFGLITPIGPQNVFVVGQGLAVGLPRALWAVVAAAVCDSLLIVTGAVGVSAVIERVPAVRTTLLVAGALFLTYLGVRAIRGAGQRLAADPEAVAVPPRKIVSRTVSVSLLNPHAILDTVGIIGTAIVAQPAAARGFFAAGALSASWLWFLLLAVAAAQARRYFTPRAIANFDRFSGAVMLLFAAAFVVELVRVTTG